MDEDREEKGATEDEAGRPHEGRCACPFCGSALEAETVRIAPGKNRALQLVRPGERKYFDHARKELFLQWFALTANIGFAAAQADVARQTVAKHRLSDPAFGERYLEALALAVPDLMARLIAYVQGRPVLDPVGELEPADDASFDPQLALQILREQNRILQAGKAGTALKPGRPPRVATNAEVEAALLKALQVFGIRESGAQG